MKKKTDLRYLIALVLLACLPTIQTSAQITIGSFKEPVEGAILDIKEDISSSSPVGGVSATKGLGLPRVTLESVKVLKMGVGPNQISITDPTEKSRHAGLLVYNVNKREDYDRLCPGLHVWNGDEWIPVQPYPVFKFTEKAGPREDLVDKRDDDGSGNFQDVQIYTTARFHSLKANRFSCDPNTDVSEYIDAGIWMTQNLRTKYFPANKTDLDVGGEIEELYSGNAGDVETPLYERSSMKAESAETEEDRINGLLYNWAAATVRGFVQGPDIYVGKGGETGMDQPGGFDEGPGSLAAKNPKVEAEGRQGICPEGWHLPSEVEWSKLEVAIAAASHLYSNKNIAYDPDLENKLTYTYVTRGNHGYALMSQKGPIATNLGRGDSFSPEKGGLDLRFVGCNLHTDPSHKGTYAHYWTHSFGPYTAAREVFTRRITAKRKTTDPIVGRDTMPRESTMSVRCKKDTAD